MAAYCDSVEGMNSEVNKELDKIDAQRKWYEKNKGKLKLDKKDKIQEFFDNERKEWEANYERD